MMEVGSYVGLFVVVILVTVRGHSATRAPHSGDWTWTAALAVSLYRSACAFASLSLCRWWPKGKRGPAR